MKKFGKFLATTCSFAALGGGAYYLYKKICEKQDGNCGVCNNVDDFDEDFYDDDIDCKETNDSKSSSREYVTLNMDSAKEAVKESAEDIKDVAHNIKEEVKSTADNMKETVKESMKESINTVKNKYNNVKNNQNDNNETEQSNEQEEPDVTVIDLDKQD